MVHAKALTLTAAALAVCSQGGQAEPLTESALRARFDEFISKHRQFSHGSRFLYGSREEKQSRFEIFEENVRHIEMVNSQNLSYTLTVNEFTDMTPEEFSFSHGYWNAEGALTGTASLEKHVTNPGFSAPNTVDWVRSGAVTPIKNQGQCGSCWTFSTTGALEGAFQVATGRLVPLSEQQIVDCDHSSGNACRGGWPAKALQWEKSNNICTENSYPYTSGSGQGGSCRQSRCTDAWHPGDILSIHSVGQSQSQLMEAVAGRPVSIAIDAAPFQHYYGGILTDCSRTSLSHAVLLVGYGRDDWKVKNSWGTRWGESGYIRMSRQGNGGNCCGILNAASYAIAKGGPSPSPSPWPTPAPTCRDSADWCQTMNGSNCWKGYAASCPWTCGCCEGAYWWCGKSAMDDSNVVV